MLRTSVTVNFTAIMWIHMYIIVCVAAALRDLCVGIFIAHNA